MNWVIICSGNGLLPVRKTNHWSVTISFTSNFTEFFYINKKCFLQENTFENVAHKMTAFPPRKYCLVNNDTLWARLNNLYLYLKKNYINKVLSINKKLLKKALIPQIPVSVSCCLPPGSLQSKKPKYSPKYSCEHNITNCRIFKTQCKCNEKYAILKRNVYKF